MPTVADAQPIFAGQVSGEGIVYHDIEDIELSSAFWWDSDGENIDLNDDNLDDLYLWTNWIYFSHIPYESLDAGANPQITVELSVMTEDSAWIRKHLSGEVIDHSLNWSSAEGIFYCISTGGFSGSFNGEGYLGFRICNIDTTYGWMRINRQVSWSGSELTVYEFAYITNYTGIEEKIDRVKAIYRVSGNSLYVDLSSDVRFTKYFLSAFDLSGRPVFQYILQHGINQIDISTVSKGIYALRLTDGHEVFETKRVVFR